mgnify:FL=1
MKNKLKTLIPIILICFSTLNLFADEDFKFESKSIEIEALNNTIIAKDGVKASTSDGLEILANESEYNKNTKILDLRDNVSILDKIQNLEIKSNSIRYNKLLEIITSYTNTKIIISSSHFITGENIIFYRSKFIIESDKPTIIQDKFGNKVELNGFNYSIKSKILKTKQMKFIDNQSNLYKSNNAMLDLNNQK